jgi:VCBS repeat-containing protein
MGAAAVTKAVFDGVTYNVRQGSNGKDTLIGGLGNDWVQGGGGNDTIADLLGNNLFDGGSGSDTIIGGIGNDVFIHRMSENVGAKDRYEGALGTDTLRLELTAAEWARADVQKDIAAFLAHMASTKNKLLSRLGLASEFTFKSMDLEISNIEKLEVRVDGCVMNLADEAVVARPDSLRTYEDACAVSVNLLANDSAPDRIASIELVTQSRFGSVTLTPSLSSATQTAVLAFTPSAAMQALAAGETRTETLTYRITDVDGDVSTSTVTIVIEGRNDVAVIGTPSVTFVQEDVGVSGGQLKASGTISISDADQGEASFKTAVVPQGDALGTLTLTANGTYTYAVDNDAVQALGAGQIRTDSFRIESVDGTQKIVSFAVQGNNDGPAAVADIAGPLVEAGFAPGLPTATGNVLENDTDLDSGDTKIVSAVNGDAAKVGTNVAGAYGNLVIHPDGSWEYVLHDEAAGTDRLSEGQTAVELFSYTTRDSQNATSSTTLTITIRGTNDAPAISGRVVEAATEGGADLTVDLLQQSFDVDVGAVLQVENLVVSGSDVPAMPDGFTWSALTLSVDPSDPAFDMLAEGQQRVLTFSYDVVDEYGARTAQIAAVTITGINDVAVIGGVSTGMVTEDAAATLTASGILTIADADAGEAAFVPQPGAAGTYGTFTLAADGSWTYTADVAQAAIQQLAASQSLTDGFLATSLDGSASQAVTVTITGTNDVAVIGGVSAGTVTEDAAATLTTSGILIIADADAGESAFVPQPGAAGTYGTFMLAADGSWTYTADSAQGAIQQLAAGQTLTDVFLATSLDGSASQAVTVTITGTNDAPVLSVTGTSIAENAEGALVATFTVADADTASGLTFRVLDGTTVDPRFVVLPTPGTTGGTPGSYEIRLAPGQSFDFEAEGVDGDPSLVRTIEVSDGQSANHLAASDFVLVVTDVPEAPAATDDHGATQEDQAITFTVAQLTGNDLNPAGAQPLAITGVSGAVNGTVSFAGGIVTFKPAAHFSGVARFDYTLDNGAGNDVGTVTIDVAPLTDTPALGVGSVTSADLVPLSGDEIVNLTRADSQQYGGVAAIDGGYVITWSSSAQDGSGWGVYQQRYDLSGVRQGTELQVNTFAASNQVHSSIAAIEGGYVVTWSSQNQDGNGFGVYQQRYDAIGQKAGGEARVNTYTLGDQLYSSVAAREGGYVVTWTSNGQDANGDDIYQRLYDLNGNPVGGETKVNTYTMYSQYISSVAAIQGGYVVAWTSSEQDGSATGIYHQRYRSDGSPQGGEVRVNSTTAGDQLYPSIAAIDGGYVVTWSSLGQDGSGWGVYQQRYDASGVPQGGETLINTRTADSQVHPSVAAIDGGYIVMWTSYGQDGSGTGLYGQRFLADGSPVGSEFRINADVSGDQFSEHYYNGRRSIAVTEDGQFIAVWDQGFGTGEVEHRRFQLPAAIEGDEDTAITVPLRVALGDLDGSESLTGLFLEGVPLGATISDGANTTISTGAPVSILDWNLATLTFRGPQDAHGRMALTLMAEVTDSATLTDGATATDVARFTKTFDVVVRPVNDAAVIGGATTGTVMEDAAATLTASGILTIADADAGEAAFVPQPGAAGTYGTFTLAADGSWTYTADVAQAAIQQLAAGQSLTDGFLATSLDGSALQAVTVTITGTNDVAVIGGVSTGTVTEDAAATLNTSGILIIADADAGESAFVPQLGAAGTYGTFSLAADGSWTYTADSARAAIQQLAAGQTLTDGFLATSLDGSASQAVTVTIAGTNDAPVVVSGHMAQFTEGADVAVPVVIDPFLTITDVDSPILRGASVAISGNYVRGEDSISVSPMSGITWHFNQVTGTLTLTGAASAAAYEATLRTVSYRNNSEHPTENDRTFTFSVSDGSAQGAATSIVSVTGVDDVATASTRKIIFADHLATSVVIPKYLLVSDPDEISASVTVQGVTGGTADWTSDSVTFRPIVPADNVTLATAQMIERSAFGPMQNSDFGSQTLPSVSVSGSLTNAAEVDWYAVTLLAGETITLDIDRAYGPIFSSYWDGTSYVSYAYNGPDTKLSIHAPNTELVSQNLYSSWLSGGGGSSYNFHDGWGSQWSYDPYIQYTAPVGGKYYFTVASEAVYSDHTWRGDARTGSYNINVTLSAASGTNATGSYIAETNPDGFWGQEGSLSYLTASDGTTTSASVAVSSSYRAQSVQGTQAAELLIGTSSADALAGNGGNDYIFGGRGSDSLSGGAGSDTFFFQKGDLPGDRIVDFLRGADQLRFAGYSDETQLELISGAGSFWRYSVTDDAAVETFIVNVELLRSDYMFI